jgi:hypothetical protein
MTEEQHLKEALKQLAIGLRNEIEDSLSKGEIVPRKEEYFRWKVNQFQYNEKGVSVFSAHGENFTRESWIFTTNKIENSIKKSDLYTSALEVLTKVVGNRDKAINDLSYFIGRLFRGNADKWNSGEADIDAFIEIFLKDIKGEPLRYGAEVELDGIVVLLRDIIEFKIGDTNIMLRQTRIEDLEKEFPAYGFGAGTHLQNPSAIMRVEFGGRQANEVQRKVEQAIAILRLYKVGSVKDISYRMYSESITDISASATLISGSAVSSLEKSLIKQEDAQKLKDFWQLMAKNLPSSFYELGETVLDHMTISYRRYCDALLVNGVLERRIANAVMGLESLFLKGGETQELSYRLGIRIAKIFGHLSYDPGKVREVVVNAYRVRSLFVHGSHLSYAEKRKLENRHGNINDFCKLLLDYLRVSIITTILTKREKEEFLDLIDDALVDKVKDDQLNNLLRPTRDAISANP